MIDFDNIFLFAPHKEPEITYGRFLLNREEYGDGNGNTEGDGIGDGPNDVYVFGDTLGNGLGGGEGDSFGFWLEEYEHDYRNALY